jgi:predicted transcriptional regulator
MNNVHIPDDILKELTALAEARGASVDELAARAVRSFLEHMDAIRQLRDFGKGRHLDGVTFQELIDEGRRH